MLSASPRCPDSQASIALSDGARGPRAGRSSQPQPTAHFGPLAHSQWRMAATSAAMPSHLCRRYILSRPPSQACGHSGRSASTIARPMQPIATTPVSCTIAPRSAKKPLERKTVGSATSQSTTSRISVPRNARLRLRMSYPGDGSCRAPLRTSRWRAGRGRRRGAGGAARRSTSARRRARASSCQAFAACQTQRSSSSSSLGRKSLDSSQPSAMRP